MKTGSRGCWGRPRGVLTYLGQDVEANNVGVREALSHAQAALAAGRVESA